MCFTGSCGGATEGFSLYVLQGRVVEPLRDLVCVFQGRVMEPLRDLVYVFYRVVWWSH